MERVLIKAKDALCILLKRELTMISDEQIKPTPWDTLAFGIQTWELVEYTQELLLKATQTPGHYSIKVDPLVDKRILHEYGFYYCDTLIEPYCNASRLRKFQHKQATFSKSFDTKHALAICHGAFVHGRFHRDFNINKTCADTRYDNWFIQLCDAQQVYGLYWQNELAGFIAYIDNSLVLHALSERYRGKGLTKYWWSSVSRDLLSTGFDTVKSSISASNLAVLNLYSSLGFSFTRPQDIYHKLVP